MRVSWAELPAEITHLICQYTVSLDTSNRWLGDAADVDDFWSFILVCKAWMRAVVNHPTGWFVPLGVIHARREAVLYEPIPTESLGLNSTNSIIYIGVATDSQATPPFYNEYAVASALDTNRFLVNKGICCIVCAGTYQRVFSSLVTSPHSSVSGIGCYTWNDMKKTSGKVRRTVPLLGHISGRLIPAHVKYGRGQARKHTLFFAVVCWPCACAAWHARILPALRAVLAGDGLQTKKMEC